MAWQHGSSFSALKSGLFVTRTRNSLPIHAPTLLEEFEGHLQRVELAPATIRNYAADIRGFVRWLEGQHNGSTPAVPRATDFGTYRTHLIQDTEQSPATINRRLQALRVFGRFLQEKGYAPENPASQLQLVANGYDEAQPRVLDDDEIAQLIVAVRASASRRLMRRDYAIIELMLQAGLRVNEVAQLKKEDLVSTHNGMRLVIQGTAEHHYRQVPLNETLARALRDYLQVRPALPEVDAVFVSQQGKPLSTRSIQRLVEAYAHAAQLEDVCANSLRHTCAKKLLDDNPPEQVAKWLGHKSVESLNKYK
ncbi:MAG: tyrosine-type recombinase/integrase [Chloroflexi bacterium]|nr:tyrosine-type recombinase/integrase [Chloroflexota bacterium]